MSIVMLCSYVKKQDFSLVGRLLKFIRQQKSSVERDCIVYLLSKIIEKYVWPERWRVYVVLAFEELRQEAFSGSSQPGFCSL